MRKVNLNVLAVARPNHAFGALKKRAEVFEERRVADVDVQGRRCAPELPQGVAYLTVLGFRSTSRAERRSACSMRRLASEGCGVERRLSGVHAVRCTVFPTS